MTPEGAPQLCWETATQAVVGTIRMSGRDQASRLEVYYATAMLVFASGVAYAAFVPEFEGTHVNAGESLVYSSLWASGYLILVVLVGLHFGDVLAVFARNWPVLVLLVTFLLPEILEPHSWLRLSLLFCTVTFCAWMASRFSLTQMILTLHYVFPIVMVIHALNVVFVHAGDLADELQRESIPGFKIYAGLFSHKNQAGITFGLSFIFYSLLLVLTSRSSWRKMLCAAMSLLFLLLSGSANALLATAVTLYASLTLWALIRTKMNVVYISVSTSIVTAVLLIVDPDLLFGALDRSSDLTGRTLLWEAWPHFFYDRLLTGYGYSGFFVEGGPAERLWNMADYFYAPNFHNSFLDVGIQAGLLGLLSLVLIVFLGIARTLTVAYTSRRPFALVLFAFFVDLCLFGTGEGVLMAHNNFVTICLLTIYFRSGIELRSRATSRSGGITAFDGTRGSCPARSA